MLLSKYEDDSEYLFIGTIIDGDFLHFYTENREWTVTLHCVKRIQIRSFFLVSNFPYSD